MAGDDDEDEAFEAWLELSEAQQEAMIDREMADYARWYDAQPLKVKIAMRRRAALESCATWRRIIGRMDLPCFRDKLRDAQIRLLKVRIWRATGAWPGEA